MKKANTRRRKTEKANEVTAMQRASAFIARRLLIGGLNGTATGKLVEAFHLIADAQLLPENLAEKSRKIGQLIIDEQRLLFSGLSPELKKLLEFEVKEAGSFDKERQSYVNAHLWGALLDQQAMNEVYESLCRIQDLRAEIALDLIRDIEGLIPDVKPAEILDKNLTAA